MTTSIVNFANFTRGKEKLCKALVKYYVWHDESNGTLAKMDFDPDQVYINSQLRFGEAANAMMGLSELQIVDYSDPNRFVFNYRNFLNYVKGVVEQDMIHSKANLTDVHEYLVELIEKTQNIQTQ
jgi:hypothetical protein